MHEEAPQLRDDISWGFQTMNQMQAMRNAWNIGDVTSIKNTTEGLFEWLYPWMPEMDRKEIENLKYAPKTTEDLYTEGDRHCIGRYGRLPKSRVRELEMLLKVQNRTIFKGKYMRMRRIILETIKKLNLGAELTAEGRISWDKKKLIFSGRRYYRRYDTTSA